MQAQLQYGVGFAAILLFEFDEFFKVAGMQHERFFTNHVGAEAHTPAYEGVVGVVGGAHGGVVQGLGALHLAVAEAVELLLFGKEGGFGERGVEASHAVKLVVGHKQAVARVGYGLDVVIPYNYTIPLVIFACFGIAAFFLALYLKVIDKKNGYGLEEPNIKA